MRIAVLGSGKMGAWLASALAAEHDVFVYDANPASAAAAAGSGRAKAVATLDGIGEAAADMLVNCVPLGMTVEAFEAAEPYLPADCMLADIASVKTGLAEWYAASGRPFVSSHPMFGPTYADRSNLAGQSAVVISESCEAGKALWRGLYEGLGIRVFEESFDGHDRTVAYSLATPFASTMVFAACMKRLDAPGTNFKKHLELAHGLLAEDDRLLAEIMFNPYTIRRLELINSQLSYLTHIIKDRDHEEMSKFLEKLRDNVGQD
ncbi:MAG: prephenate dehydrogenase/arogenate dehydrogenase family protein [Spirochaetae bacterium HGW-Spirochaetae-3]|jgi:prephenate dehydrogenase|nr:MAG: prephenate dehydrogenase/arogenate dehydrogenase family protein [Spirochaetae bacterium HGW-Spirochaetae-3]